jgi:hypothetical protein
MITIWIGVGDQRTSGVLPIRRELAERVVARLQAHRGRAMAEVGGVVIADA